MKRLRSRLIIMVTLLATLSACGNPFGGSKTPVPGSKPTAGAGSDTRTIVSFATWESDRATYEPLAESFMQENPNIKIVLVPIDDIFNAQGSDSNEAYNPTAALRNVVSNADTAPSWVVPPEGVGSNLLLDLKPLMEADTTFQTDDFYEGAIERYTVDGETWMLPRYFYFSVLMYNKDLFQKAGVPTPKEDWTWTDALDISEQVAQSGGSPGTVFGMAENSGGYLPFIGLLQEKKIDIFGSKSRELDLTSAPIVEAMTRVRDMYKNKAMMPPVVTGADMTSDPSGSPSDPIQAIQNGQVGIWSDSLLSGVDPTTLKFQVGYLPYPSVQADFGGGDGFIVSSGTEHPNEAWKWVEFLSRQPLNSSTDPSSAPGQVPARRSLASATTFWDKLSPDQRTAYERAIALNAQSIPSQAPDYLASGALSQALTSVINDPNMKVDEALAQANRQFQDQVAQVGLTPTPQPDDRPVVVSTPESQDPPPGTTPITFLAVGYDAAGLRRVARTFNQQSTTAFVKVQSQPNLTAEFGIKDAAAQADCFSWWAAPQKDEDFAELADIQPLMDADTTFPKDDFAPALLAPYRHEGGLYGVPHAYNIRTLTYNATAFQAANIQPPTADWKPSDFLAAAQALTTGNGATKQYGYVALSGASGGQQELLFFINQFGGQLITGKGNDARPNFTDARVNEAIQWYIDLAKVHQVRPSFTFPYRRDEPFVEDQSYSMVQNGQVGMWFDFGYGPFTKSGSSSGDEGDSDASEPLKFQVGVAPLPISGGGLLPSDMYSRAFYISGSTQAKNACWDWIKFLTSDLSQIYGDIPARRSVAESDAFLSQARPEVAEVAKIYSEVLQTAEVRSDYVDPSSTPIDLFWFYKAINAVIEKNADLKKELEAAQATTTAFMECYAKEQKAASCAKKVDPEYQGFNVEDTATGVPEPRN